MNPGAPKLNVQEDDLEITQLSGAKYSIGDVSLNAHVPWLVGSTTDLKGYQLSVMPTSE